VWKVERFVVLRAASAALRVFSGFPRFAVKQLVIQPIFDFGGNKADFEVFNIKRAPVKPSLL